LIDVEFNFHRCRCCLFVSEEVQAHAGKASNNEAMLIPSKAKIGMIDKPVQCNVKQASKFGSHWLGGKTE